MSTIYIVTRRLHYAGMDEPRTDTLGVFTSQQVAELLAVLENCRYAYIADDCEITEFEVDEVLTLDDGDKDDYIEFFLNGYPQGNEDDIPTEVVDGFDMVWPEWRVVLEKARAEWEAQPPYVPAPMPISIHEVARALSDDRDDLL